jgi:hypothetical protein
MPLYDMYCAGTPRHKLSRYMTYAEYDEYDPLDEDSFHCPCGHTLTVGIHSPALYGTMKCKDQAFADAEEATGHKITSTHDIDRLEKAGIIRAVTNPSRHRVYKDKQYREKQNAFRKKMGL